MCSTFSEPKQLLFTSFSASRHPLWYYVIPPADFLIHSHCSGMTSHCASVFSLYQYRQRKVQTLLLVTFPYSLRLYMSGTYWGIHIVFSPVTSFFPFPRHLVNKPADLSLFWFSVRPFHFITIHSISLAPMVHTFLLNPTMSSSAAIHALYSFFSCLVDCSQAHPFALKTSISPFEMTLSGHVASLS